MWNQEENHLFGPGPNRNIFRQLPKIKQTDREESSLFWGWGWRRLNFWCIHLWLFRYLDNQFRQLPRGLNPQVQGCWISRLTVGGRGGLQYVERKQKAGGRVSRVEWWCDTLLKQATVPTPLTVCLWAHVAIIAASTEPADCTHYLLLASKKPHAELYEIFIQCVHFSSLFPLFLPFPIPHLGPPLHF